MASVRHRGLWHTQPGNFAGSRSVSTLVRDLLADLRSGVRLLVRFPTLSVAAILALGLGIGLSTTVFCIVDGALFKGLPFPQADRIVALAGTDEQGQSQQPIDVHDVGVLQERLTAFDAIGPYATTALNLSSGQARPDRFATGQLSAEALRALGVTPVLGRLFQPEDDRPGAAPVVLLGDEVWRDKFNRSPDVLGRTVRANGVTMTVVGVMPDTFGFPVRASLWVPLQADPLASVRGKGPRYQVVGRLKPGVSIAQAQVQARTVAAQLQREYPDTNRGESVDVEPYARTILGAQVYALLYTMLGAGIGVLLIACVNVSNVLIARAALRQKEVAVRMALGAAPVRVLRQHLTEVLVLALVGGVLGIGLSVLGLHWFLNALSVNPPPFWIRFGLDARIVIFVAALIVATSLFAGVLPAWQAARVSAGSVLKDESRSSTSSRFRRFSGILVVAELAVSCGLLVAAGLMVKSVTELRHLKMPFAIDGVLTGRVNLPRVTYANAQACVRFYETLLPRLEAVPGVVSATLSDGLPAAGNGAVPVQIEGKAYSQASDYPVVREGIVTPGYFETFETRPIRGADVQTRRRRDGRAGGGRQRDVRADLLRRGRPRRAAHQTRRRRLDRALAGGRRRRARHADAGHRQQQPDTGGLLPSDCAKRRHQLRQPRGADRGRSDGRRVGYAGGRGIAR